MKSELDKLSFLLETEIPLELARLKDRLNQETPEHTASLHNISEAETFCHMGTNQVNFIRARLERMARPARQVNDHLAPFYKD